MVELLDRLDGRVYVTDASGGLRHTFRPCSYRLVDPAARIGMEPGVLPAFRFALRRKRVPPYFFLGDTIMII
jgi:hypothetical protein